MFEVSTKAERQQQTYLQLLEEVSVELWKAYQGVKSKTNIHQLKNKILQAKNQAKITAAMAKRMTTWLGQISANTSPEMIMEVWSEMLNEKQQKTSLELTSPNQLQFALI